MQKVEIYEQQSGFVEGHVASGTILRGKGLVEIMGKNIGAFEVKSAKSLTQGITAVTNEVFEAIVATDKERDESMVIVKVGNLGIEYREKSIAFSDGCLGGWLKGRLENEVMLIQLAQNHGVATPQILAFEKLPCGKEVLVEQKLEGENCLALRKVAMSGSEHEQLEAAKGELLAKINTIPTISTTFGPLSEDSMHFATWQEYFTYKLSTTLSLLYGMYGSISKLAHFSKIVATEQEWEHKIGVIAQAYSSEAVQELLVQDGTPTVTHGDYWDANIFAQKGKDGKWITTVIDFERGDISGKSFDLALWLEWKLNGNPANPNLLDASEAFLQGYQRAGGEISPKIKDLVAVYALWQYLDFLILDVTYGIDRTDESAYEINKLARQLQDIADKNVGAISIETLELSRLDFYINWLNDKQAVTAETLHKKTSVTEVFGRSSNIVIDGLRLPASHLFEDYLGQDETENLLRKNITALKDAGVDGVVLETSFDRPHRTFYTDAALLDYYVHLAKIAKDEAGDKLKVGINLILFDLPGSLAIAKVAGLDFVVTDEFIENIVCPSKESYLPADFVFIPQPKLIREFRQAIGATNVLLFAGTHSNYYESDGSATIKSTGSVATEYGADALVIGKKNANQFDANIYQLGLPIFVAGGVSEDDLQWIKQAGYNGFMAGSLFEKKLTVIDPTKAEEVVQVWLNI